MGVDSGDSSERGCDTRNRGPCVVYVEQNRPPLDHHVINTVSAAAAIT